MPSTEEREAQPVMEDPCPRCGFPVVLRYWKDRFFTKCQNPGCAFGYDTDNRGNPKMPAIDESLHSWGPTVPGAFEGQDHPAPFAAGLGRQAIKIPAMLQN